MISDSYTGEALFFICKQCDKITQIPKRPEHITTGIIEKCDHCDILIHIRYLEGRGVFYETQLVNQ